MLKVCILTETYYPVVGGGETQARLLADGLVALGASVCVLTRRSDPSLPRYEQQGSVRVHRLWPVGRGQFKKWGLLLSCGSKLLRLRHEYDLIFVSGFRIVGMAAVLAAKLLGKRVVLKADSQGEMSGAFFSAGLSRAGISNSSLLFRLFLRARNAILMRADAFVAITPDVASEFSDAGIPDGRIHRVPNGVDAARFRPLDQLARQTLRERLGLQDATGVVVYTGRLVSYKGLPLLLQVWRDIVRAQPAARLLLVGEGGMDIHNCEAKLETYVRSNGLDKNVTFVGKVEDVSPYLHVADVFAFPTENDAFPSSLVEAMSCGLPVVATPVGAIGTIVRDGENGLLVQPGNFVELTTALQRLIRDPGLSARLGESARRTALADYSAESVTRLYVDLFRDLGARRQSRA